jgi:hypothetical protein
MITLLKSWLRTRSLALRQVNRTQGSFRPRLEGLEDRALLSAGWHPVSLQVPALGGPGGHALASQAQPTVAHSLSGQGSGTYSVLNFSPGVGATYKFQGSADLAAVGHVTITGSVHSTGNIAQGHARGLLTFTNARGSVTIELTGPEQTGSSGLTGKYDYQVVGHTGAYAFLTDSGSLTLALAPLSTGGAGSSLGTFTVSV